MDDCQVVVFKLSGEEFAVDIRDVREIIKTVPVTEIPEAPEYIRGIINLRNDIIVIVDLERKLNVKAAQSGTKGKILIVDIDGVRLGVLVDEVSEVLRIPRDKIKSPTKSTIDVRYLRGVAVLDHRMILIVEFRHLLDLEELKKHAV